MGQQPRPAPDGRLSDPRGPAAQGNQGTASKDCAAAPPQAGDTQSIIMSPGRTQRPADLGKAGSLGLHTPHRAPEPVTGKAHHQPNNQQRRRTYRNLPAPAAELSTDGWPRQGRPSGASLHERCAPLDPPTRPKFRQLSGAREGNGPHPQHPRNPRTLPASAPLRLGPKQVRRQNHRLADRRSAHHPPQVPRRVELHPTTDTTAFINGSVKVISYRVLTRSQSATDGGRQRRGAKRRRRPSR
jgi:hypothetical protein